MMQPSSRNINILRQFALLACLVPAIIFMTAVIRYTPNIPIYDDITQVIWIINAIVEGQTDVNTPAYVMAAEDRLHMLFYSNAGHIPTVTRLIALAQYSLGGINFHYAEALACTFWLASVWLLMREGVRSGISLFVLLPVPFLLFSLVQWEAMASMLGSVQMYIGTLFLPFVVILALVRGRIALASFIFFIALFASGGAMGLVPLGIGYLMWKRNYKNVVLFTTLAMPSVFLFHHFDAHGTGLLTQHLAFFGSDDKQEFMTNLVAKVKFFFVFLGNITTNGSVDLRPLADRHFAIGLALLIAGLVVTVFCKGHDFFKLVYLYSLILAVMTTLMRAETDRGGLDMVPRYAVFALLTCAVVYVLIAQTLRDYLPRAVNIFAGLVLVLAIGSWTHSAKLGREALIAQMDSHVSQMKHYITTGDASSLLWDPAWCDTTLKKAKTLGVYDYSDIDNY